VELRGIDYGDLFPWLDVPADATVYMVDFSLQPFTEMDRLHQYLKAGGGRLVWIDHHKSAIQDDPGVEEIAGLRRVGNAGCELTWEYLFPDEPMPRAVKLIGRHDVWDHSDPDVEPFQYGLRLCETNPEHARTVWEILLSIGDFANAWVSNACNDGKKIMAYQQQCNAAYACACIFETELDGYRLLACNRGLANSKIFDDVWPDYRLRCDAMCLFVYRKGRWEIKLFTDHRGLDVSLIAKAHGGGGHTKAAGFVCEELPFELR
jgi:hypothetical protein